MGYALNTKSLLDYVQNLWECSIKIPVFSLHDSLPAGRDPEFLIWTEKDCSLVTGSREHFDLPLQLAANTANRKIKATHGKFGIVERESSTPQGDTVYTVRRYQEKREGRIQLRVKQGNLEVYFLSEEGTNGKEELLEGVTMTYDTSKRRPPALQTAVSRSQIVANIGRALTGVAKVMTGIAEVVSGDPLI